MSELTTEVLERVPSPTVFGRLQASDPRDANHTMRSAVKHLTPKRWLPRTSVYWMTGPTLNQGNEPACVGFTGEAFLRAAPVMARAGRYIPPGMTLYREAQKRDEWPGENYAGTSARGLMRYLLEKHYISEYVWAERIEDIRDFVLTRGPVCVGTDWWTGMSNPTWEEGQYPGPYLNPVGGYQGGHEWLVIGYSKVRDAFRMLNSWGLTYGEGGRAWIRYKVLDTLVFQQNGDACSAIEIV